MALFAIGSEIEFELGSFHAKNSSYEHLTFFLFKAEKRHSSQNFLQIMSEIGQKLIEYEIWIHKSKKKMARIAKKPCLKSKDFMNKITNNGICH